MDQTISATCEALDFYLTQKEVHFGNLRVLIIQGTPANYTSHFSTCDSEVISYHAAYVSHWKSKSFKLVNNPSGAYDLIIHFAAKSDRETQFELDRALQHLKPEGQFIGVVHNRMGATRYKKQLQVIFPEIEQESKSKCRVFSTVRDENTNIPPSPNEDQTFLIPNSEYLTLPGVYGENNIDEGSKLLASLLQNEYWSGIGADIGCGYGYLSGEILKTRHKVKQIWLYEVDSRALQMAERNLSDKTKIFPNWTDVTKGIPCDRPVHWAVMNPPFHSGTTQDFALGQRFIQQAAAILKAGAPLFMVANQHLPYEETLHENFRSVVKLIEQDGFKCFKAVK